jgi:hypothetical protein
MVMRRRRLRADQIGIVGSEQFVSSAARAPLQRVESNGFTPAENPTKHAIRIVFVVVSPAAHLSAPTGLRRAVVEVIKKPLSAAIVDESRRRRHTRRRRRDRQKCPAGGAEGHVPPSILIPARPRHLGVRKTPPPPALRDCPTRSRAGAAGAAGGDPANA